MSMEMNKALVEQAGGDERAAFELFVRKHCGMPAHIAVNWDAKFTNDAWEGWKARAALEPSPVQAEQAEGAHVPDEVFAGVFAEWWEEEGQYCRAGGGDYERTFAFQAWRHLYPLLLQARAALAQPSPAQAEAERPEVVARVVHSNPVVLGQCGPLNANDELMTVAQHAASVARWAEMFNRVEQQRDAAMARVAELEAHCVRLGQGGAERYWENRWRDADARLQELEKQEPVATVAKVPGEDWNSLDFHRDLQDMQPGTKLYTAPVAQAQHSVPEISGIGRDAEHPRAVVLYLRNEPSEEDMRAIQNFLRAISADVLTQAQHSMPKAWLDVQAERRRQITAEGWTPDHDDLYCAAELPRAAAAYILSGANDEAPAIWPFSAKWWKPRDARANYMRAGALILAEIERLDRAAAAGKEVGHE
ncbi:hypothetical protein PAERUG_P19_London_7_VIM_2_05_10_02405 [Pseudomonas aeruginosa]|uniref:Uncharacterized protein n=2 Tax=Pseudomonas aeruginosa TaxID=287 RepID=A0A9P1VUV7_PSEAI|nr:hypothetical protein PaeAG1_03666 [Pseudomonas aeruginosa]CDI90196.1 hypothetical protein BN889_02138 [Pseudomonas aeruginosa PA38182]CRN15948.1 hypothetical protein PAERUG_P37_London_28_VIM_2_07_12_00599 [Pseudomonas aeruginosa]CRN16549.1 hypothetical protein PAERUG_E9_London_17_VIM_2_04_13_00147 [Pseudomonas aeruginosa]CRN18969.1 hypothetical protein PAERUG_P20_London_17_VIM_2_05_10_00491 [Pseudomonas aeruginosa]